MIESGRAWSLKLLQSCYFLLVLSPLLILFAFPREGIEIDKILFQESLVNTFILAISVLLLSTVLGVSFAVVQYFFKFPYQKIIHVFLMLPLAIPTYVMGFIYLGALGASSDFYFVEMQGQLWFLIVTLSLCLTPYVYFFTYLGLKFVTQSEVEAELILRAGWWSFFKINVLPKMLPFLISAQVLLVFEALADFGAASVINVPVLTTMIYKAWFDLFSFAGAVSISLKYSIFILLVLLVEFLLKRKKEGDKQLTREPVKKLSLSGGCRWGLFSFLAFYIFLSFLLPLGQIVIWSIQGFDSYLLYDTLYGGLLTLFIGGIVGLGTILFSFTLSLFLREMKLKTHSWAILSTVGYSVPGTILAVSMYALLLMLVGSVDAGILMVALVVALGYKFLTVSLRPIADAVENIPLELDEVSQIFKSSFFKRLRTYLIPYTKDGLIIGLLLVMIEVMKEMPLTLMLAPSEYQTLSIKIFNYTSEGEWLKASLPSLLLMIVGVVSVILVHSREKMS